MNKDVREYIKTCDACARRKTGKVGHAPLGDALEAKEFLDVVSLDIVGPLPTTERGNQYLLTFIDHFTRFCDAIPIPNQTTEVIAREFVTKVITQFGVPKKLLTDRGANFTSALLRETCRLLKIHKLQTCSFNPQANGICERMHKLLVDMLSHFVRKEPRNWDDYVPYAVMAYRAMPHSSTTYSPYYLVFGRDLRLPIEDDWRPKLQTEELKEGEYEEYVRMLALSLKEAHKEAGQQSKLSHWKAKYYYDDHTRLEHFVKGDLVYLYDPIYKRGKAKKFAYKYKGPYEIKQRISPLVYKIRVSEGTDIIVHVNRLKQAQMRSSQVQEKLCTTSNQTNAGTHKQRLLKQAVVTPKLKESMGNTSTPCIYNKQIVEAPGLDSPSGSDQAGSPNTSPLLDTAGDEDWTPESRYWQRKFRKDNVSHDLPYWLRSRTTSTQESTAEADMTSPPDVVTTAPAELLSDTGLETTAILLKHSYNLRNRTLSH